MIPEGWERGKLGDYVKIRSGVAPSKIELTDDKSLGRPYVKVDDMNLCYKYQEASREYVVGGDSTIGSNAVLFPKRGAAIMNNKVRLSSVECFIDSNMMALEAVGSGLDPEFLYYSLVFEKLYRIADTSTIPQINNKHINPYPFALPPLREQKKIAAILSTWDKAITKTERLIETGQQQRHALMQQLLTGTRRLPGFEGGWQEKRLGDLFGERNETGRDELPLLAITGGSGVIDRGELARRDTSSEDKGKYKRICIGDIGYNTMRMWQGVSGLSDKEGLVSPAYTVVTPGHEADGLFFSYLFKFPRVIHEFYRHSQGLVSDTWNLKYRHFSEIKVAVPEVDEQKAIAKVLSQADAETEAQQRRLDCLRQEKRALMQQLLTGKRRVKVEATVPTEEAAC